MIFDTHAHVLSADREKYPFGPLRGGAVPPVSAVVHRVEDLVREMDECGVARACLVQRATLYGYDNSYALDAAAQLPERFVPVVVLDAQEPSSPAKLRALTREHRLGGVRLVAPTLTRDDTAWLDSTQALEFWKTAADLGLPVTVILYWLNKAAGRQALLNVARHITGIPILVDHVGLPHPSTPEKTWCQANGHDCSIPSGDDFGIAQHISRFDDLAHVRLKVTDINFDRLHDAGLDAALFLRALADRFGAERLVWGSDVGQSPAPYAEKLARLAACAAHLSESERAGLFGGNAQEIYGHALAGH
ncbi:amidohydrolase family protein [Altererythrobacter fulvus]|uniref:amidohydrolase family protein n=1 Tax=Caenibius fulvus TaxID=2126012 RepID=UPI00301A1CDB